MYHTYSLITDLNAVSVVTGGFHIIMYHTYLSYNNVSHLYLITDLNAVSVLTGGFHIIRVSHLYLITDLNVVSVLAGGFHIIMYHTYLSSLT